MDSSAELLRMRLRAQMIEPPASSPAPDPHAVVSHLCAMQGQDYPGALWAVGLRCGPKATIADVERAIDAGQIVRTWPMRGTLHFLAAEDVRWMLALLAPRVESTWQRRHRELDLSDADLDKAVAVFREGLAGGQRLSRPEMLDLLQRNGLSTDGQRGYHLLAWSAQRGVICLGPIAGTQQTFVLLDEWVPASKDNLAGADRLTALAHLAKRYFTSHGPATAEDLMRWTRLSKRDVTAGIELAGDGLRRLEVDGMTYYLGADTQLPKALGGKLANPEPEAPRANLLPGFDEYFIGYADRTLLLAEHSETYMTRVAANGLLRPTVVVDGRVVGTWKRTLKGDCAQITVQSFRTLTDDECAPISEAAEHYARFLGLEAAVAFESA